MSTVSKMMAAVAMGAGGAATGLVHRWWRLKVTRTDNEDTFPLWRCAEVQFFMKDNSSPVDYYDGVYFSSSNYFDGSSVYPAQNAFDFDNDTWWASNTYAPFFFGVKMPGDIDGVSGGYAIVGVNIVAASDSGSVGYDDISGDVTVQSSSDTTDGTNGTWLDEFSGTIVSTNTGGAVYPIGEVLL